MEILKSLIIIGGSGCNASILTLAVITRLIGFIRKTSRMGKREEREKEGKAMPSSTRIYWGSIIIWPYFIVFFFFSLT